MIAFRLVISHPPKTPLFQVNVYTTTNQAIPQDSGTPGGKWIDLNVTLFEHNHRIPLEERQSYQLILEIVGLDENIEESALSNILNSMTPMLVIYSYDDHLFESLFQVTNTQPNNVIKRSVSDPNLLPETETLEEKQKKFCQLHTVNLTSFHNMGLSMDMAVTSTTYPSFNFCYGHCKPENVLEDRQVTPNSELVGLMEPSLVDEGIVPCCVPKKSEIAQFVTRLMSNSDIYTMITVENVVECGCY